MIVVDLIKERSAWKDTDRKAPRAPKGRGRRRWSGGASGHGLQGWGSTRWADSGSVSAEKTQERALEGREPRKRGLNDGQGGGSGTGDRPYEATREAFGKFSLVGEQTGKRHRLL